MTTAIKTFDKKSVWHSELVKATDPDGLLVVLKGKPRDSKFEGKNPYVYFGVMGDDNEYSYNIENENVRATLEQSPTTVPVRLHAFGSREAATITVDAGEGDVIGDSGPPQLYPEDEDGRPQATQSKSPTGSAVGDLYLQCLLSARKAHEAFIATTKTPASDDDIRIATTMFIQAHK